MAEWCLYRAYNVAGDLLYIGQTSDLPTRIRCHKREKPWWSEVARVTTEHVGAKGDAAELERNAIRLEAPRHNVQLARPQMAVTSFRLPAEVKEKFIARAEREGLNPTEVVRDLATEWAEEGER